MYVSASFQLKENNLGTRNFKCLINTRSIFKYLLIMQLFNF
jgi:hypothetical protein